MSRKKPIKVGSGEPEKFGDRVFVEPNPLDSTYSDALSAIQFYCNVMKDVFVQRIRFVNGDHKTTKFSVFAKAKQRNEDPVFWSEIEFIFNIVDESDGEAWYLASEREVRRHYDINGVNNG